MSLVLLLRLLDWLHARFAEAAPEPVEEGQTSEFAELKEEMLKNKKRIKSMMAMLEAQNKLLKNLAAVVDPKFKVREDVDGVSGAARASLEGGIESEMPK